MVFILYVYMKEISSLLRKKCSYTSKVGFAIEKLTFGNETLLANVKPRTISNMLAIFVLHNGEYKVIRIRFKENKTSKHLSQ